MDRCRGGICAERLSLPFARHSKLQMAPNAPFPCQSSHHGGHLGQRRGRKYPSEIRRNKKRVKNTLGRARSEEKGEVLCGA